MVRSKCPSAALKYIMAHTLKYHYTLNIVHTGTSSQTPRAGEERGFSILFSFSLFFLSNKQEYHCKHRDLVRSEAVKASPSNASAAPRSAICTQLLVQKYLLYKYNSTNTDALRRQGRQSVQKRRRGGVSGRPLC